MLIPMVIDGTVASMMVTKLVSTVLAPQSLNVYALLLST